MATKCDCYGCQQKGQGTCGRLHCATCGGDFTVVLRCEDEETNRRICPTCDLLAGAGAVERPAFAAVSS